jgi:hypothetical protein
MDIASEQGTSFQHFDGQTVSLSTASVAQGLRSKLLSHHEFSKI